MSVTKRLEILDLIRELRQQLNLSQKQFATKLEVSFKTVKRWQNRHTVDLLHKSKIKNPTPHLLTQTLLSPWSSSLPFPRGGLGWGKTDAKNQVSKLFQTCVYTVAGALGRGWRWGVRDFCKRSNAFTDSTKTNKRNVTADG
ncbi:helix-turn-helix domain-containing protein [Nostoc sp. CHAB 5715]|uniref:helix-turn-helix domain-containing protein n=1 Tax=Nostoc sp. CHAB 5715 TaxID=2780400 RepID=UPI001E371A47|nr:helix-turn-helix domain-containing protein [Nostoc sp. CHAB 5715]MCC5625076.1 helix-turn-helix domain-containing protein [Nostoc sp. CHAB 5715]